MTKRIPMKHKRREAPEWVFPWRMFRDAWLPKASAWLLVAGGFVILLTFFRIRVVPPVPWASDKASVIHVTNDEDGRVLKIRAREGGPFPSRFDPAEWPEAAAAEQKLLTSAGTSAPLAPALRRLACDKPPEPPLLSSAGDPVLPKRRSTIEPPPSSAGLRATPLLHPLSGITPKAMPAELPVFDGPVDPAMKAGLWRFLLHLDAAGNVLECVSLAGGDEPGLTSISTWLRRISFGRDAKKTSRWIALGLSFANLPAATPKPPTDGPDSH